jgi:hypothetical protein
MSRRPPPVVWSVAAMPDGEACYLCGVAFSRGEAGYIHPDGIIVVCPACRTLLRAHRGPRVVAVGPPDV